MKLYTEEQVIELVKKLFWQDFYEDDDEVTLMSELTPIELPSDDEIKEKVELILSYDKNREEEETVSAGFALGAYWVLNHIKQQGDINAPLSKQQDND